VRLDLKEVGAANVRVALLLASADSGQVTVAVTDDASGFSAVIIVPSNLSKRPRTLLTIMCLTVNETSE